jgi:hypothetical protein
MPEQRDTEPTVWLVPGDTATARVAGRDFARTLAGAPSELFAFALAEQSFIVQTSIRRFGLSKRQARLAADAFDASGAERVAQDRQQGSTRDFWHRIGRSALIWNRSLGIGVTLFGRLRV